MIQKRRNSSPSLSPSYSFSSNLLFGIIDRYLLLRMFFIIFGIVWTKIFFSGIYSIIIYILLIFIFIIIIREYLILNSGADGNVYSYSKYAIKVFKKHHISKKECEILRILLKDKENHHLVPHIYCLFSSMLFSFILMERYQSDLLDYLNKNFRILNYNKKIHLLQTICMKIKELHKFGIAHRDIKPENILINNTCDNIEIRICDFAHSVIPSYSNEFYLDQIGTPQFNAPEISNRKYYNPFVSDIYSLGCMFYVVFAYKMDFTRNDIIKYCDLKKEKEYNIWSLIQNMINDNPLERPTIEYVIGYLNKC